MHETSQYIVSQQYMTAVIDQSEHRSVTPGSARVVDSACRYAVPPGVTDQAIFRVASIAVQILFPWRKPRSEPIEY